jgi:hypothetical protein
MSEQEIYNVLLDIKEDVGAVKAMSEAHKEALEKHIEKTESLSAAVRKVELAQARQKGAARVYSAMGGVMGAFLGAAATYAVETFWKHP